MLKFIIQRKGDEKWGFSVNGGKDQSLTAKVGKVKVFTPADRAGLRDGDYLCSINGNDVFEMSHKGICEAIIKSSSKMEVVVERGDHIVPNFAELWPQNNPNMGRKKRVGMEYYMSALQHHGLSGHLPQPENFTTCGKQPIEIAQYNSPIECYTEEVIDEMTQEITMATIPQAVDAYREMHQGAQTFDPTKSAVLSTIAAEEHQEQ